MTSLTLRGAVQSKDMDFAQ